MSAPYPMIWQSVTAFEDNSLTWEQSSYQLFASASQVQAGSVITSLSENDTPMDTTKLYTFKNSVFTEGGDLSTPGYVCENLQGQQLLFGLEQSSVVNGVVTSGILNAIALPQGGTANFQPLESVSVFFYQDAVNGECITQAGTQPCTVYFTPQNPVIALVWDPADSKFVPLSSEEDEDLSVSERVERVGKFKLEYGYQAMMHPHRRVKVHDPLDLFGTGKLAILPWSNVDCAAYVLHDAMETQVDYFVHRPDEDHVMFYEAAHIDGRQCAMMGVQPKEEVYLNTEYVWSNEEYMVSVSRLGPIPCHPNCAYTGTMYELSVTYGSSETLAFEKKNAAGVVLSLPRSSTPETKAEAPVIPIEWYEPDDTGEYDDPDYGDDNIVHLAAYVSKDKAFCPYNTKAVGPCASIQIVMNGKKNDSIIKVWNVSHDGNVTMQLEYCLPPNVCTSEVIANWGTMDEFNRTTNSQAELFVYLSEHASSVVNRLNSVFASRNNVC